MGSVKPPCSIRVNVAYSLAMESGSNSNYGVLMGQVMWNGVPVIDDDDGGTAGVREPRRPRPSPLSPMAMAREVEPDFCFA